MVPSSDNTETPEELHSAKAVRVLFVCLGNICRSPLAEGVLADVADKRGQRAVISIDSAGTGGWHVGAPPDPRSLETAARHGIDISRQRCRQVASSDFTDFDLILAMDRNNLKSLKAAAPAGATARIALFMDEALGRMEDVPDPYYGEQDGFETVYSMLFAGCSSLLAKLAVRGS